MVRVIRPERDLMTFEDIKSPRWDLWSFDCRNAGNEILDKSPRWDCLIAIKSPRWDLWSKHCKNAGNEILDKSPRWDFMVTIKSPRWDWIAGQLAFDSEGCNNVNI